jgi:hypothetical protein
MMWPMLEEERFTAIGQAASRAIAEHMAKALEPIQQSCQRLAGAVMGQAFPPNMLTGLSRPMREPIDFFLWEWELSKS